VAIAIVSGALFLFREDAIGFVDLFEALFGIRLFIDVRVILARQFTKCRL